MAFFTAIYRTLLDHFWPDSTEIEFMENLRLFVISFKKVKLHIFFIHYMWSELIQAFLHIDQTI